jgi:hypothetical protein
MRTEFDIVRVQRAGVRHLPLALDGNESQAAIGGGNEKVHVSYCIVRLKG